MDVYVGTMIITSPHLHSTTSTELERLGAQLVEKMNTAGGAGRDWFIGYIPSLDVYHRVQGAGFQLVHCRRVS
jgi:hypothetical protein